MSKLFKLLSGHTVRALKPAKKVISVTPETTLGETIQLLAKNNVLAAPVVDSKDGTVRGMIDMLDIVFYAFMFALEEKEKEEQVKKRGPWKYKQEQLKGLHQLVVQGKNLGSELVKDVSGISNRDPLIVFRENTTLAEAVHYFTLDVHRSPVCDADNRPIGMVSQSNVVEYLSTHLQDSELRFVAQTAAKDGLSSIRRLVTVKESAPVIDVLETMYTRNVSSVALVDEQGLLCGTFSASDLRGLLSDRWVNFSLPVKEFLRLHSPRSLHCATCRAETTLLDMCKQMTARHVHRLWIVDRYFRPVDVVSMSDIMDSLKRMSNVPSFPQPPVEEKAKKPAKGQPTALLNFLQQCSVLMQERFLPDGDQLLRPIVTCTKTTKIREAAKLFADNRVLSLPLVEPNKNTIGGEIVVGSLDISDMVYHVLQIGVDVTAPNSKLTDKDIHDLLEAHVSTVEGTSRHTGALIPLRMDSTLDDAVSYFTLDVYRCPIVDFEGSLISILSHMSVIKLLSDNLFKEEFKFVACLPVSSIVNTNGNVKSVSPSTTVFETLLQLRITEKSALAITDPERKELLVGNFSVSNVLGVFNNPHNKIPEVLRETVTNFLRKEHPNYLHCITCSPNSTLLDVVRIMASTGTHRVWVVNDAFQLLGVVSTCDVMNTLKANFFS